ncbi:hypothetical protein [Lacticaseibacillus suihuaensis]
MTHIKGITVTLIDKIQTGTDPFGHPTYKDSEVQVDNVLVAPTTAADAVSVLDLTGRKAIYTLAIPKGDTHDWEDKEVRFFDQRWRVFGIPLEGIEANTPLDWNRKVTVERYA